MYLHFKSKGFDVYVGATRNLEVDFVLEKGDQKIYVQVCYILMDENVIEREYRSLDSICDNYPKMIVSMDDTSFGIRNGIHHKTAMDILLDTTNDL